MRIESEESARSLNEASCSCLVLAIHPAQYVPKCKLVTITPFPSAHRVRTADSNL